MKPSSPCSPPSKPRRWAPHPLCRVAKRLVIHHNLTATIITFYDFSTSNAQRSIFSSLPFGVSYVSLPSLLIDDPLAEGKEQPMNVEMLVKGVMVALRPIVGEDGVTRKEAVANVMRELVDGGGKELRNRIRGMMKEAAKAIEHGGPSYKSLANIANLRKMTKHDRTLNSKIK
ncbi:hypothetical protein HPP92_027450 [Vanilla planifolia]|uniref:Uncharacterized protein n=1 Tax=Vanilla planifolia TaxID=51239 RepID=A0A835RM62_VANPL|nr:hypothetical protein HPP92_027450 [Vanilla planifolia]KAG0493093.1 hypothetical protein HPP92_006491 [Vanilla planifolia]